MNSETATVDALRAQNIALQVQLSSQERELAQCREALSRALASAGNWGSVRDRVVLSKVLNSVPPKAWPPRQNPDHTDDASRAAEVLSSFEAQLIDLRSQLTEAREKNAHLTEMLSKSKAEVESLASRHVSEGSAARAQPAVVAHLMAQIKFLHAEVERLEKVAAESRERSALDSQSATSRLAKDVMAKDRMIAQLKEDLSRLSNRASGSRAGGDGTATENLQLEERLSVVLEEKSNLLIDKTELQAKLRKLDATLKSTKMQLADSRARYESLSSSNEEQHKNLHAVISKMAAERGNLQATIDEHRLLNSRPMVSVGVAAISVTTADASTLASTPKPVTAVAECQVNSITALRLLDQEGASAAALMQALDAKCQEHDTCRLQLEDAKENLRFLSERCRSLSESLEQESSRRKTVETDCERLGVQVRALQQQSSQLQVAVRDRESAVRHAELKLNEALAVAARAEEDRRSWQAELASNTNDIDNLVAQQSLSNHQVAAAAAENDALRNELQTVLQREAQLGYTLKAREAEMTEMLAAYQRNVQENEVAMSSVITLERECDNLRAMMTSRDERIMSASEQINAFHFREQQLTIDLQSCDYENGLLHRKLVASENKAAQSDAHVVELSQQLQATQRMIQEFERSQAELHKQLVIKENELMLLRQRCDIITKDGAQVASAHQVAVKRVRELEDANARLAVRGVMAHVAHDNVDAANEANSRRMRDEVAFLSQSKSEMESRIRELTESLTSATSALHEEQRVVQALRDELADLSDHRDTLVASQQRLEDLVRAQAATLASCE